MAASLASQTASHFEMTNSQIGQKAAGKLGKDEVSYRAESASLNPVLVVSLPRHGPEPSVAKRSR